MELRELIGGEVESANPDVPVVEAVTRMLAAGIGSLAIVDAGELIGIFTERDLVKAVANGADLAGSTLGDLMTAYPDSFLPDMTVAEAAVWMLASGYRHMPVAERGELIGMASIKDVLWAMTIEVR